MIADLGLVAGLVVSWKAVLLLAPLAADSWQFDAATHAVLKFFYISGDILSFFFKLLLLSMLTAVYLRILLYNPVDVYIIALTRFDYKANTYKVSNSTSITHWP